MRKRLIGLFVVMLSVSVFGASGDLDTSFSADGKLITDLGGFDSATDVVIQPDGKIVVVGTTAGNFAVVRYGSTGALDSTFGGDGIATVDFGGTGDLATSVALQADGKIVVAGGFGPSNSHSFAVARLNTDGTLDATFDGDGRATLPFGETARGIAIQPDGKIAIVGSDLGDIAIARFNRDGTPDSTFDGDGRATEDFGSSADGGTAIAVHGDNLVVAGSSNGQIVLTRFDSTGRHISFVDAGQIGPTRTTIGNGATAHDLVIQPDGKIVVVGESMTQTGAITDRNMAIVRYNANGTLDTTFAGSGFRIVDFGLFSTASGVSLLPDGGIVLVGFLDAPNGDFAIARLRPDGSQDSTFSGDGLLTIGFGAFDLGSAVAVQPSNGRIVVAGTVETRNAAGGVVNRDFGLARIHAFTCRGLNVTRLGTQGDDTLTGFAIFDRRTGQQVEQADVIHGLGGNDTIDGRGGNDTLCGGAGNDILIGGPGDDVLDAGPGADSLTGGDDHDTCLGVQGLGEPADSFTGCEEVFNGGSGFSGSWKEAVQTCNSSPGHPQCVISGAISVFNPGTVSTATRTVAAFYLSADETLDEADTFLQTADVGALDPGQEQIIRITQRLTGTSTLLGYFLIASLDHTNIVPEINEANNVVAAPITGR